MKIGFAQLNPTVGDLKGNFERILPGLRATGCGRRRVGYYAGACRLRDTLHRISSSSLDLSRRISRWSATLHARVGKAALLVGFVDRNEDRGKPFHNAAALLERGQPIAQSS